MSLHNAAKHLAAHGRGSDTTLVHMTPGEVDSLQSLAQQHGGSLTTNPHTGLPEAGFLSALLPMAAGAGLAAMGMPAGYAALSVGAASALTNGGDLRKGMMAGISAYGGAGMAESFMGAGLGTMGGAMGTSAVAPTTVLETPAGATSPYALTGASATPSTTEYSLGESSSFLNKPIPTLASAAPAEVARTAAAATPAAQAARQAAALNDLTMGQRWDALKAGATGANAMSYIKDNPLTSLGVTAAMLTPDEDRTPQKTTDTDRGPRAKMQYYPGWSSPMPKPNMQGIEQTFNRPYYMAKGGSTEGKDYGGVEMSPAMRQLLDQQNTNLREIQRLKAQQAGIPSAPLDQKQLFADYLQRVSGAAGTGTGTGTGTGAGQYDWWKNPNDPGTSTATAETPEEYAARMRLNARGGGGGKTAVEEGATWVEPTSEQAYYWSQLGKNIFPASPLFGGLAGLYGNYLARNVNPNYGHEERHSINPPLRQESAFSEGNAGEEEARNYLESPWAVIEREDQKERAEKAAMGAAQELKHQQEQAEKATQQATQQAAKQAAIGAAEERKRQQEQAAQRAAEYKKIATEIDNMNAMMRQNPNIFEGDKDMVFGDTYRALENQLPKIDSPFGDRYAPTDPYELGQYAIERVQQAKENLEPGDRFAPVDYSNQFLPRGVKFTPSFQNSIEARIAQQDLRNLNETPEDGLDRIGNPSGNDNGSDNNGAGVHEGGYSNSLTRSNDQGDGGGANGGLSTPYGFQHMANGGLSAMANSYNLGSYSDGGRLLKGPGDGVSDSIPATIGKGRPARLADGEFVIPARIVSEIGNGSTDAGARKLYAMMDRIQAGRKKSVGKGKVAVNSRADKHLPA